MSVEAKFTVYGANVDELKEAAYDQAVKFFRTIDDEITLEELEAIPVVEAADGTVTRWKATVKMKMSEDNDE